MRVLHYLKSTIRMGLKYKRSNTITGYSDSDWAGDPDQRRSTAGNLFMLLNESFSWKSQTQRSVALSALEAEYVALSLATREATWTRSLLTEIFSDFDFSNPIEIQCNNQGAIAVAINRRFVFLDSF
jgi:hypothetical protein